MPTISETSGVIESFVPSHIRQGLEWAEQTTVNWVSSTSSELTPLIPQGTKLGTMMSGTGISPSDYRLFEDVVSEVPEAVEMMEIVSVDLAPISISTGQVLEMVGAEALAIASLNAVQVADMMEEKMSEMTSAVARIREVLDPFEEVEKTTTQAFRAGETIALNTAVTSASNAVNNLGIGAFTAFTEAASEASAMGGFYMNVEGQNLLAWARRRDKSIRPTDEKKHDYDEWLGAWGYAQYFWHWGKPKPKQYKYSTWTDSAGKEHVLQEEVHDSGYNPFYSKETEKDKISWGDENIWLPVKLLDVIATQATWKGTGLYDVEVTHLDGTKSQEFVEMDPDGIHFMDPFPKKELTIEEAKSFLPLMMMDNKPVTVAPNSPILQMLDIPTLFVQPVDKNNKLSELVYVWFQDNGIAGQLLDPYRQPPHWGWATWPESLPGTNLWYHARVVAMLVDRGYWVFLSPPYMEKNNYGFWFRIGIDGPLLKDSEDSANACTLFNLKLLSRLASEAR